jgi:membrane protein YqaA with SNARE-associated domain
MIRAMHLVIGSGILDLGQSPSAFGETLALALVFFVLIGGLVNFLIGYIIAQVLQERAANQKRAREYNALHKS